MNSNVRTRKIKAGKIPQSIAQLLCRPLCEAGLGLSMRTEPGTEPSGPAPSPKAWLLSAVPAGSSLTDAHARAAESLFVADFFFSSFEGPGSWGWGQDHTTWSESPIGNFPTGFVFTSGAGWQDGL